MILTMMGTSLTYFFMKIQCTYAITNMYVYNNIDNRNNVIIIKVSTDIIKMISLRVNYNEFFNRNMTAIRITKNQFGDDFDSCKKEKGYCMCGQ